MREWQDYSQRIKIKQYKVLIRLKYLIYCTICMWGRGINGDRWKKTNNIWEKSIKKDFWFSKEHWK